MNITLGGVGRNIAHNLALLGVPVTFLGVVGDDDWGRKILGETGGAGVDVEKVKVSKKILPEHIWQYWTKEER